MSAPIYLSRTDVLQALRPAQAVDVIVNCLRSGARPDRDHPRSVLELTNGQLLLMPSEYRQSAGVKVLGVSPENPSRGEPRIHGVYVLMDSATFEILAVLDGAALTLVRTPAVSFAGIRDLIQARGEPLRIAVIGAGPQAIAHHESAVDLFSKSVGIRSSTFIARTRRTMPDSFAEAGSDEARTALNDANLVMCATSSAIPVLHAPDLHRDAIVVAIGSHEPTKREIAGEVFSGAAVIVEDRATALREAGDVILAVKEGVLDVDSLIELSGVATGAAELPLEGHVIVKTTGMSWEDVVIARAILNLR
ncbi:ornithine cyclodeaminase family protein [Kribbella sp. NPDC050124]|uniref:ornithine cyclodeaminase family protein n=1 Tax=Kribbella sp. NPDC050124 TaxID=3364114 RepID=UPI0037BD1355